ncbi:MAG: aminoacetone oxidase family FAD-binding enzyme, partial [Chlamydiota bacterium]
IIDCLTTELKKLGVVVAFKQNILSITKNSLFEMHLEDQKPLLGKTLILATGSHPLGHKWAQGLGHTLESAVPSLFTFNIPTSPLKDLSGICLETVKISLPSTSLSQKGPLLITHFGFSGPAVIKLSAWGARYLHEKNYEAELNINWLPDLSLETILNQLLSLKKASAQKSLLSENPFKFPKNFWKTWLGLCGSSFLEPVGTISNKDLGVLSKKLSQDTYLISGKTTHKEEFVTCGGVVLKEISFKTMESKLCPGLFFAGEILDIDGVTGGFNFQNAWTTAFIAGSSIRILKT